MSVKFPLKARGPNAQPVTVQYEHVLQTHPLGSGNYYSTRYSVTYIRLEAQLLVDTSSNLVK